MSSYPTQPLEKTTTERTIHPGHPALSEGHNSTSNLMHGSMPLNRQISVQLTPDQFERLYLQPGGFGASKQADLTKRFANPTVLGLAVFVLSLTPVTAVLMGWMGTSTNALLALSPSLILLTGIGLWTAGILEWILGNTFPFVVFTSFSGLYFGLGFLLQPTNGIAATLGAGSVDYNNAISLWLIFWCILTFVYFIISLRTNVVFVILFLSLDVFFMLAAAAYHDVSGGNISRAGKLFKGAGALAFVCCLCGWYLFIALMMSSNNFPVGLPLGDLSNFLETPKEKRRRQEAQPST